MFHEKTDLLGGFITVLCLAMVFLGGYFAAWLNDNNIPASEGQSEQPTMELKTSSDAKIVASFNRMGRCLVFEGEGVLSNCDRWLTLTTKDKALVEAIIFEGNIDIGPYEFEYERAGFVNLKEVCFSNNDNTAIGEFAFAHNPNLMRVVSHKGGLNIGENAFNGCSELRIIYSSQPDSCKISKNAVSDTPLENSTDIVSDDSVMAFIPDPAAIPKP